MAAVNIVGSLTLYMERVNYINDIIEALLDKDETKLAQIFREPKDEITNSLLKILQEAEVVKSLSPITFNGSLLGSLATQLNESEDLNKILEDADSKLIDELVALVTIRSKLNIVIALINQDLPGDPVFEHWYLAYAEKCDNIGETAGLSLEDAKKIPVMHFAAGDLKQCLIDTQSQLSCINASDVENTCGILSSIASFFPVEGELSDPPLTNDLWVELLPQLKHLHGKVCEKVTELTEKLQLEQEQAQDLEPDALETPEEKEEALCLLESLIGRRILGKLNSFLLVKAQSALANKKRRAGDAETSLDPVIPMLKLVSDDQSRGQVKPGSCCCTS